MNPVHENELRKHMLWLVKNQVSQGYQLKQIDTLLRDMVVDARKEIMLDLMITGMTSDRIAIETGFSIGFVCTLTTELLDKFNPVDAL